MTICGGQRDAPRNTIPKTNFRRDAGPSTALAGYAAGRLARIEKVCGSCSHLRWRNLPGTGPRNDSGALPTISMREAGRRDGRHDLAKCNHCRSHAGAAGWPSGVKRATADAGKLSLTCGMASKYPRSSSSQRVSWPVLFPYPIERGALRGRIARRRGFQESHDKQTRPPFEVVQPRQCCPCPCRPNRRCPPSSNAGTLNTSLSIHEALAPNRSDFRFA